MSKSLKKWRDRGHHLPPFMRDFHDQKELFKSMEMYFTNIEECPLNWMDAHVYTIDWFLWFMAAHGYTLQKTRSKKTDFNDIDEWVRMCTKSRKEKELGILIGALGGEK